MFFILASHFSRGPVPVLGYIIAGIVFIIVGILLVRYSGPLWPLAAGIIVDGVILISWGIAPVLTAYMLGIAFATTITGAFAYAFFQEYGGTQ